MNQLCDGWFGDFIARLYRGLTHAWKLIGEALQDAQKRGAVLNPRFADYVMEVAIRESMASPL